jgi:hypothetical protein
MTMAEWVKRLDRFLEFNEYPVLENAGTVSAAVAKDLAEAQYEKFQMLQDRAFESDFDREVRRLRRAASPGPE